MYIINNCINSLLPFMIKQIIIIIAYLKTKNLNLKKSQQYDQQSEKKHNFCTCKIPACLLHRIASPTLLRQPSSTLFPRA